MDTVKFAIHPSDGRTPMKEILQAVDTFVTDFHFPPSELVVNPSDLAMMENNEELLSISPGLKLLVGGGMVSLLPYLTLRASQNVESGSASLEGTIEL